MTPTRELAAQVIDIMNKLLNSQTSIKSALLIGGEHISGQLKQLQRSPRLIVGTPGRINDHLQRGSLRLHDANFLVLDETDRMLDMGFGIQLDAILPYLPKQRQTLLFSATLPPAIVKLAQKYTTNPARVSVGESNKVATKIKQETIFLPEAEKYDCLLQQLEARTGSIVLFIKTKHGADKMAIRLRRDGVDAEAIHGDLRQNKRDKVIQQFRNNKFRVLVATDVASRGLDIPHIMHVINFDLPQVAEDYIHRIGRTARAGAEGEALCLISPKDARLWRDIQTLLDPVAAKAQNRDESRNRSHGGGEARAGEKVTRNSRGKPTGAFKRKPEAKGAENPYAKKRPFGTRADGESRFEKPRGENRFEKRDDSRGEAKTPFDKKPEWKSDKPAGGFAKKPYAGKSSGKPEWKSDKPAGKSFGKPEWKSDKPAGKPSRSFANSNSATAAKPEWKSDKPAARGNAGANSGGKTYVRRPRVAT
jgi:superfamily II DNA/RNA helicase